jgi:hypothetical protein
MNESQHAHNQHIHTRNFCSGCLLDDDSNFRFGKTTRTALPEEKPFTASYLLPAHITPTRHSLRRDYTLGTPGVFLIEPTSFLFFSNCYISPSQHFSERGTFQQRGAFFCLRYQQRPLYDIHTNHLNCIRALAHGIFLLLIGVKKRIVLLFNTSFLPRMDAMAFSSLSRFFCFCWRELEGGVGMERRKDVDTPP